MASPEYNIESLVIAILQNSATFSGVDVEHFREDDNTVAKGNRLEVRCEPKTPLVEARKLSLAPYAWQAQITVSAVASNSETTWDSWKDGVDEALTGSVPSEVTTEADTNFEWLELDAPTGGGEAEEPNKRRRLTRQLRAVFRT